MSHVLGKLAQPRTILLATAVTCVLLRRRRGVAARLLVAVPVTLGASKLVKRLVPEHRPRLFDKRPRQSLPSSHASLSTAYLCSLVDAFGAWWAFPLVAAAIAAIDRERVASREHWPKDVLVGNLIGVGGAVAGSATARALEARRVG